MKGLVYYSSPVGELSIESENDKIISTEFLKTEKLPERTTPVIEHCINELDEYFHKGRKFFTVELQLRGTGFQQRVWGELLNIPFGKTRSYADIANALGDLHAVRAVGLANGQNPFPIIIPCHRVIGKDGSLVGYGGGIEKKKWLLYHEGALLHQTELF